MIASLQVESICKSYRNAQALASVSFQVEGGKTIVLLGANGAGKTTLLRVVAGLEKPDSGTILIDNVPMTDAGLRQVATLVFQKTAMFSRSVYDNLAYGMQLRHVPKEAIKQKVTEALEAVGLQGFEKRKAKRTSGGEQQRISLARALLLNPKILLLDEPTANLDPTSIRAIERAIVRRRNNDEIIIMATHNLGQVKRLANFVIFMHEGRIVEFGTTKDLFDNPKEEITRKFLSGEMLF